MTHCWQCISDLQAYSSRLTHTQQLHGLMSCTALAFDAFGFDEANEAFASTNH